MIRTATCCASDRSPRGICRSTVGAASQRKKGQQGHQGQQGQQGHKKLPDSFVPDVPGVPAVPALLSCPYSSSSSRRSAGIFQAVTPTTPSVIKPPKITEGTVPRSFAATPDSKEPISFEEPMKIWFTAETRPSRGSGVRRVSSVERITT